MKDYSKQRREIWMKAGSTSGTWLISFTDVIALMLTFFVLIFSMINPEREILSNISHTIRDRVGTSALQSAGDYNDPSGQRLSGYAGQDLSYLASILQANIQSRSSLSDVRIELNYPVLTISLPQSLLFNSGSFDIKEDAKSDILSLVTLLKTLKNAIYITGYTDPVPVTVPNADYASNTGLGLLRAQAVADAMKETGYKSPLKLYSVQNYNAESDYDVLRRVDIVIHKNRY